MAGVTFEAPADSPAVPTTEVPTSVSIDAYDRELAQLARLEAIQSDDAALQAVFVALRVRGYPVKELATLFAMDVSRVRRILRQARADGALQDVVTDLTTEALPLAVEKLIEKLELGEAWAIRETLKGLGAFKTHPAGTGGPVGGGTSLEVTFIMPPSPIVVDPKAIVGQPREARRATVHPRQIEGAAAEALRPGEPGRTLDGGSPGEGARGEGPPTP